ncbi:MAG: response regulator transcription factor [Alteripontixanthobacter sp.]
MPSILVVDDDDLIGEHASSILIEAGYACGWVSDGEKALDLLKWRRPDLLLLDHDMPGMSGGELLRQLRKSAKFYDLPVVMLTAMTGEQDEAQARYYGAQDYIRKPFDPKFLKLKVAQNLKRRRGRPGHVELDELVTMEGGRKRPPQSDKPRYC